MGAIRKVVLLGVVLVLVGAGVGYYVLSRDHYDPSKYSATITPPTESTAPVDDVSSLGQSETYGMPGRRMEGRGGGELASSIEMDEPSASSMGLLVGSRVELTLPDQFDDAITIAPETEIVVMAFSKSAGDTVRFYLDDQESNFLSERKAVFVADISPIPVVIRNLVLRTLKKRSYQTLLIYEEEMATALRNPEHANDISIVRLQDNEVVEIEYVATKDELHTALAQASD